MSWVLSVWGDPRVLLGDVAPPGVDLSMFAQYGVLGVFVIILIVFARTSYKREIDRADRLESEVRQLHELRQTDYEKTAAALAAASEAIRQSAELINDLRREDVVRRDDDRRRRTPPVTRG